METQKISFTGSTQSHRGCSLTIENLTYQELDLIKGMLQGRLWATTVDGRLNHRWNLEDLPPQTEDVDMLPFWRKASPEELAGQTDFEFNEDFKMPPGASPSLIVSGICGYNYTPEAYVRQAAWLTELGFVGMRSRRDEAGKYSEHWILQSFYTAKGPLKEFTDSFEKGLDNTEKLERVTRWLCKKCSFGSLDVSWQRCAIVAD